MSASGRGLTLRDGGRRGGDGRTGLRRGQRYYRDTLHVVAARRGLRGCGEAADPAGAEPETRWRRVRHLRGAAEPSLQGRSPAARPASLRCPLDSLRQSAAFIGEEPFHGRRLCTVIGPRARHFADPPSPAARPARPIGEFSRPSRPRSTSPSAAPRYWLCATPISPRGRPPRPLPYGVSLRARAGADWPARPAAPPSPPPIGPRAPLSPSSPGRGGGGGVPALPLPPPAARPRSPLAGAPATQRPRRAAIGRGGGGGGQRGRGSGARLPPSAAPRRSPAGLGRRLSAPGAPAPSSPPRRRSGSAPGHHER